MGKRQKKKSKANRTNKRAIIDLPVAPINYEHHIPVYDFFENVDLNTGDGLGECIDDFIFFLEDGYFLMWEAVVLVEKGLPLNNLQQEAFDNLINFSDDDGPILYINEIPRPSEPWYEIFRKIAPNLILDPFETYEIHDEIYHEDWLRLTEGLDRHAQGLSLPKGISHPIDVIPPEIVNHLWLQVSFDVLSGIGQEQELTLENNEQKDWRIENFIDTLKFYKDSVKYFDLTMEKLFKLVKLPLEDEKILVREMLNNLQIPSITAPLSDFL